MAEAFLEVKLVSNKSRTSGHEKIATALKFFASADRKKDENAPVKI